MSDKQRYTKTAIAKLTEELKGLTGKKRKEVAERIREAKSFGDLSENSEYKDAREAQAFVEGRIEEIENILENAEIIEDHSSRSSGIIDVGSVVTVVDNKGVTKEYSIVSANEVDSLNNKISTSSPIGSALMGRKVEDETEVTVPAGKMKFKIKKVE